MTLGLAHSDLLRVRDREDKLPKWAQQYLDRLRMALAQQVELAEGARLDTDPDGSDAIIDFYHDTPIGLGQDPRVRFKTPRDEVLRYWGDYIDVSLTHDKKGVVVQGGDSLSVQPVASNVVEVKLR